MRRNSENKIGAHLMQVIAPHDVRLQGSDGRLTSTPNPRSTLASGERALQATQLARVGLGDVGSTNPLAIGERGKACQSKVNAEAGAVHLLGGLDLNVEHDVPLAGLPREDDARGCARQLAMPADLDLAGHPNAPEFAALADREPITNPEVCSVVAIARAQAREPGFGAAADAAEECGERLLQLAQHLLLCAEGPARQAIVGKPRGFQFGGLIIVASETPRRW
jgi:hypothetical protein